jgi:hypothetical protein
VLADPTQHPIPGATVALPEIALSTRADEKGRFRVFDVPAGLHTVSVRQPGFSELNVKLEFDANGIVARTFALTLMPVTATLADAGTRRPLAEFEERRAKGNGHFITRTQLDQRVNARVSDLLTSVPGMRIVRSPAGPQAWASMGRGKTSIQLERQPDVTNRNRGAPSACSSDVYLDGVLVYGGTGSDLFDVNSMVPAMLEGIEFYVSGSHVPPEYNRLGSACGVLLFWTRRGSAGG